MTREELAYWLERATNALADIALSQDPAAMQHKAARIYAEIRAVWHGPGPDDGAGEEA